MRRLNALLTGFACPLWSVWISIVRTSAEYEKEEEHEEAGDEFDAEAEKTLFGEEGGVMGGVGPATAVDGAVPLAQIISSEGRHENTSAL